MNVKKLFFVACHLFGVLSFAQVGINTITPNAQLDIRATSATAPSNTDGLLIPKIDVFPTTNPTAAQQGMLVYLTTTVGTNTPGFYYWDNPTTSWVGIGGSATGNNWTLAGNTVNATTDFMGSTNDADVIFKRNNVRAGRIGIENTSFGVDALNPASTGSRNTATGVSSLSSNTTGYGNAASGTYSLYSNTTGFYNTATGVSSLSSNTTGDNNTASGSRSLFSNTTGNNNTASGSNSLFSNTTGSHNAASGRFTLYANTTGNGNTASGSNSLTNNTTGNQNTASGNHSLSLNTTGIQNTASGVFSLYSNTTGNQNTGIGYNTQTGSATNVLTNTTAIGANASANTSNSLVLGSINGVNGATASANVGIGTTAPNAALEVKAVNPAAPTNTEGLLIPRVSAFPATNPTAAQHGMQVFLTTAVGTQQPGFYYWDNPTTSWVGIGGSASGNNWALAGNTVNATTDFMGSTNDADVIFKRNNVRAGRIGANNTSFGVDALNPASTGFNNTASGYYSLFLNTIGYQNTASGSASLQFNTIGYQNTASGNGSLRSNTTGNQNTASGVFSLYYNTTGSSNTALGYNAFSSVASFSNSTALGANTFITASNQVRLGANFVTSIGGQVDWTTLSDARFKTENATKVPGIDFIKKLRPVTYYVDHEAMNAFIEAHHKGSGLRTKDEKTTSMGKSDYKPEYIKTLESGFMAQEVEQAAKELGYEFNGVDVPKNDDDYYGLRYGQFVVPLVKAVQELNEKLEQKQAENDQLKAMLLELEKRIAKLEKSDSN